MREALREGGQVILLLNRPRLSQRTFTVPLARPAHRDVPFLVTRLTTCHQLPRRMLCHYCGYEQEPLTELLAQCGQAASGYQGLGKEKLQAEIEDLFPAPCRAAHGQRHHAAAGQPRARVGGVPRGADPTS